MAFLKRRFELDFDLSRRPGTGLPTPVVLPGPALFNYMQSDSPDGRTVSSSALWCFCTDSRSSRHRRDPNKPRSGRCGRGRPVERTFNGQQVQDIIVSQNLDFLAVTETWITCNDPDAASRPTIRYQSPATSYGHGAQPRWRRLPHSPKYHRCQTSSAATVTPLSVNRVSAAVRQDVRRFVSQR